MSFWKNKRKQDDGKTPETFQEALEELDQDMNVISEAESHGVIKEFLDDMDDASDELHETSAQAEEMHEAALITLSFPDGTMTEYELIGVFRTEDDRRQYMALHPLGTGDDSAVEISPFDEGPDGDVVFVNFIDDEEYEYAADLFDRYFGQNEDEI